MRCGFGAVAFIFSIYLKPVLSLYVSGLTIIFIFYYTLFLTNVFKCRGFIKNTIGCELQMQSSGNYDENEFIYNIALLRHALSKLPRIRINCCYGNRMKMINAKSNIISPIHYTAEIEHTCFKCIGLLKTSSEELNS